MNTINLVVNDGQGIQVIAGWCGRTNSTRLTLCADSTAWPGGTGSAARTRFPDLIQQGQFLRRRTSEL
jgi:hypothetical protein